MTTLFVGPDAGEMGWSECCLAPHARFRAAQLRATEPPARIVIGAPADRHHLYADFATELIDTPVEPGTSNFLDGRPTQAGINAWESRLGGMQDGDLELRPTELSVREDLVQADLADFRVDGTIIAGCATDRKLWHRYGDPAAQRDPRLIALAFRPPKVFNGRTYADKAWPYERCHELVSALHARDYCVAYMGGDDNWAPAGTTGWVRDLRGHPLERQCRVLSEAALTVGPSSAPLHLSQLCGTPVVTWYAPPSATPLAARYGELSGHWNPFRTRAHIVAEGRHPDVDEVLTAIEEML